MLYFYLKIMFLKIKKKSLYYYDFCSFGRVLIDGLNFYNGINIENFIFKN